MHSLITTKKAAPIDAGTALFFSPSHHEQEPSDDTPHQDRFQKNVRRLRPNTDRQRKTIRIVQHLLAIFPNLPVHRKGSTTSEGFEMSGVQSDSTDTNATPLPITNVTLDDIFTNRNEENTADAAFEGFFGKSDPEKVARRRHHASSSAGKVCYKCKREFDLGEPVYRARTYVLGRGFMRHYSVSILSYCKSCAPYRDYHEGACNTCSRDVYFPWDRVRRKRVFCSTQCSQRYYVNVQREKRQAALRKTCSGCGDSYVAKRKDSKFCSAGCKQRAYRVRQGEAT